MYHWKILQKIKSLNISKKSDADGINARILWETVDQSGQALKNWVRKKVTWRYATTPMERSTCSCPFKKRNHMDANTYRLGSLTAKYGKLLEKIVKVNLVKTLQSRDLIDKDKHGFREHSCCTQLLGMMEVWARWFDLGLPWETIYIAFTKAFDGVTHQRLLNKYSSTRYPRQISEMDWVSSATTIRGPKIKFAACNIRHLTGKCPRPLSVYQLYQWYARYRWIFHEVLCWWYQNLKRP